MELTIALCTYNPKVDILIRAVRSVVEQIGDLKAEFLIVDNNSQPPLRQKNLFGSWPVKIIEEPVQGLTAARECAIRAASSPIILFVDDDNILESGYLHTVLEIFRDPRVGLAGGAITPEYESTPPPWFSSFESMIAIRRHAREAEYEITTPPYDERFPIGAGFAVRRDLAQAYVEASVGNARIEGRRGKSLSSAEDIDLALFIISRGYTLRTSGKLMLTHVIPAFRVTEEYIARLAIASLISCVEVERKWRTHFNSSIFTFFSTPTASIVFRIIAHGILGLRLAESRIKRAFFQRLLQVRRTLPPPTFG